MPFDVSDISPDMAVRARLLQGDVVIEQHEGATIFLEGFVQAVDDPKAVIVEAVDGKPIDVVLWVAVTDPALVISH